MPKGFGKIQEAVNKINESSQSGGGSGVFYLKLPNHDDSAIIRALEQGDDVYSFWYHDFSKFDKSNGWRTKIPCLDQEDEGVPCPGCENDLSRKLQGLINIIWRDAPNFKRDEDGKFERDGNSNLIQEGNKDQVAVWSMGPELLGTLAKKDVSYKGLSSRDLEVTRIGEDLKTKYSVEPADLDGGATKLSAADKKLADKIYDLEKVANFRDYDAFEEAIENKVSDDDNSEDVKKFLKDSPFGDE